ncbi:MAG: sensor histidine kinase [Egibacteraceae bacterium]
MLVLVGALTVATVTWGLAVAGGPRARDDPLGPVLLMVAPIVAGYLVGARRRAQREVVEGERRLEEVETRRAVLEERTRIARELHDVVAHHMSMIAVQAETAPFRIPDLPETSKECLAEISSTARGALIEMRRLLGVLRSEDAGAERGPQPGLEQVDELVGNARRAGVTVDSAITGRRRPLPPGTDLSAYRIVQEALSNAIRHAPGASIRVETRYEPEGLRILITNEPPPGPPPQMPSRLVSHGLVGMRERVAMLGGALAAGPTPDGGYAVEASLPLEAEASS